MVPSRPRAPRDSYAPSGRGASRGRLGPSTRGHPGWILAIIEHSRRCDGKLHRQFGSGGLKKMPHQVRGSSVAIRRSTGAAVEVTAV